MSGNEGKTKELVTNILGIDMPLGVRMQLIKNEIA